MKTTKKQVFETLGIDKEVISGLIQAREKARDREIEKLDQAAIRHVRGLAKVREKILAEEITCFKDTVALQKRMIEDGKGGRKAEKAGRR